MVVLIIIVFAEYVMDRDVFLQTTKYVKVCQSSDRLRGIELAQVSVLTVMYELRRTTNFRYDLAATPFATSLLS